MKQLRLGTLFTQLLFVVLVGSFFAEVIYRCIIRC